jgi:N-hydroxyarylamine O-acetyltransferase
MLGFQTRLISARPYSEAKGFGPEFDHAAIVVSIEEKEYLVDVGFGDFAAAPLEIAIGVKQVDREGIFRIISGERESLIVEKKSEIGWQPEYMFGTQGRDLAEFTKMCDFQQYSPDSHFTKGKLCSLMTDAGRKTLRDRKYIVTENAEKKETTLDSEEGFYRLLRSEFDITPEM